MRNHARMRAPVRRWITLILITGLSLPGAAQMPAYRLFREDGKKTRYEKMAGAAAKADVVLFGELHDDPIVHWLQLELTRFLYREKGDRLVLGAEMFEADNQLILDEYLAGLISEDRFEKEARLWENYETDYKPLVEFAMEHGLRFIATNIPRRYANAVYRQGLSVLGEISEKAREYIAPLPLVYDTTLNCYASLAGGGGMMGDGAMMGHRSGHLRDAQAIKDATMAHFILESLEPGKLMLHFNGAYHSDDGESMNWFLEQVGAEPEIVTISTVRQEETGRLEEEFRGKADFIICVPSTMTRTH